MTTRLKLALIAVFLVFAVSAQADQVKYLPRPEQSLAAFTEIVARAQKSIDLATFILEPCHASTQILLEKLAERAKSGVRVRILLDDFQLTSEGKESLAAFFTKNGIEFRTYSAEIWGINSRMHVKLTIVDSKAFITGGRNISDRYFGLDPVLNYVDRDVLVTGASVTNAQAGFNEIWNGRNTSRVGARGGFASWKSACGSGYSIARINEVKAYLAAESKTLLAKIPTRDCADARVFVDASDFAEATYNQGSSASRPTDTYMTPARLKRKRASASVLSYLDSARSSVHLENWMYAPIYFVRDAFDRLRDRNVKVDLMTNLNFEDGPDIFRQAGEVLMADAAERDTEGSQQVMQINPHGALSANFKLTPKNAVTYLHAKTMVRDQRDALVGSFNLDSRSYCLNLEVVTVFRNCAALAGDVEAGFKQTRAAFELDRKNPNLPPREEPSFFAEMFAWANIIQF